MNAPVSGLDDTASFFRAAVLNGLKSACQLTDMGVRRAHERQEIVLHF